MVHSVCDALLGTDGLESSSRLVWDAILVLHNYFWVAGPAFASQDVCPRGPAPVLKSFFDLDIRRYATTNEAQPNLNRRHVRK